MLPYLLLLKSIWLFSAYVYLTMAKVAPTLRTTQQPGLSRGDFLLLFVCYTTIGNQVVVAGGNEEDSARRTSRLLGVTTWFPDLTSFVVFVAQHRKYFRAVTSKYPRQPCRTRRGTLVARNVNRHVAKILLLRKVIVDGSDREVADLWKDNLSRRRKFRCACGRRIQRTVEQKQTHLHFNHSLANKTPGRPRNVS